MRAKHVRYMVAVSGLVNTCIVVDLNDNEKIVDINRHRCFDIIVAR